MTTASLSYLAPLEIYKTEKAFAYNYNRGPDVPASEQSNLAFETHENVPIYDARTVPKDELNFEKYGFRFLEHPSSLPKNFSNEEDERQRYIETMTEVVRKEFGAEHAVCNDFRSRCNGISPDKYKANIQGKRPGKDVIGPPIMNIHVDQTPNSGMGRICRSLSQEEIEKYTKGAYRCRIINAWRPINRPAQDCPLTWCAWDSIKDEDLVPVDRYNPEFVLELYYLKYAETQKWWWIKDLQPEEIAVFCQYDSEGKDGTCPHTAFLNPNAPADAGPRESLEVRMIVFNKLE